MIHSHHRIRTEAVCRHFVILATCVLILGTFAVAASAQTDLLKLSSRKSELAETSRFYDIAAAGTRLVAVGERGHIMYSDDHGASWTQADVPVRVALTAVCFASEKEGWAVGHDAVVLHTADGGGTWEKLLDGFQINDLELALYQDLVKAKEIELAQADEVSKEDLTLELEDLQYKLEDVQLDGEDGAWKPLLDVWFDTEGHGVVIGVFGTALITGDGGKTWQSISNRISNPDGYHYKNVTKAGDVLIIGGEVGILYRSTDNGQSWQNIESPSESSCFGMISNISGDLTVGTSFKGGFIYTLDQGESWSKANAKTKATLADGTALPDGSIAVVSYAGQIFQIAAKGGDISVKNMGRVKFPGMTSIVETSDKHLVAVGQKGLLRVPVQ